MTLRARIALVIVWSTSLVGVAAWAQAPAQQKVISGSDLGFRVEGQREGTAVGRLVIRVNGQWVEAGCAPAISR